MFTLVTIGCIRCQEVLRNDQISVAEDSRMRTANAELAYGNAKKPFADANAIIVNIVFKC